MTFPRRSILSLLGAAALAAGCAQIPPAAVPPPIVFVHGNGDSAALWQTTLWRFESNGWPRERLHALDMPYPLARNEDAKPQPGRTSADESALYVAREVDRVRTATGAAQVVLMGNSRGANAIRHYLQNFGGAAFVSHAVLGGGTNHGVFAIPGLLEGGEFSGTGPFLRGLNQPKNAAGDEVVGPVRWLTVRSDNNDKYAQPDGLWVGMKGKPTGITYAAPELKGATNVVIAGLDHRETSFSPAAFEAGYRFITGQAPRTTAITPEAAPVLSGKVMGSGLNSLDAKSGDFSNNLPVPGARVRVWRTDPATGERQGSALHDRTVADDGVWGPFTAQPGATYEFQVEAPGYATTHFYRSAFPRSSNIVHLRPDRIAEADRDAGAVAVFVRPRGYLDPVRDKMQFDGQTPPPGIPPNSGGTGGAGVASSKIKYPSMPDRALAAEFNGERVVGRAWNAREGHVTVLELHY